VWSSPVVRLRTLTVRCAPTQRCRVHQARDAFATHRRAGLLQRRMNTRRAIRAPTHLVHDRDVR
jgi:hypothetical protein